MQSLIDQLQDKVKSYKKQIEEAEEIAALNLAKYRKVAGALGDAEASADPNEQAMAMRKARAKSASLGLWAGETPEIAASSITTSARYGPSPEGFKFHVSILLTPLNISRILKKKSLMLFIRRGISP